MNFPPYTHTLSRVVLDHGFAIKSGADFLRSGQRNNLPDNCLAVQAEPTGQLPGFDIFGEYLVVFSFLAAFAP